MQGVAKPFLGTPHNTGWAPLPHACLPSLDHARAAAPRIWGEAVAKTVPGLGAHCTLAASPSPGRILWEAGVALLSPWQWQQGRAPLSQPSVSTPAGARGKRVVHICSFCTPSPTHSTPPFQGMQFGWMQFGKGGIKRVEGGGSRPNCECPSSSGTAPQHLPCWGHPRGLPPPGSGL